MDVATTIFNYSKSGIGGMGFPSSSTGVPGGIIVCTIAQNNNFIYRTPTEERLHNYLYYRLRKYPITTIS